MFRVETNPEPDEYTRLVWLLAINDQLLSDIAEHYDSGTDSPAPRVIETRLLPSEMSAVPPGVIAEYRTMLVRYGEKLRGDIQRFRRVRMDTHELGQQGDARDGEARHSSQPQQKTKKSAGRTPKKRQQAGSSSNDG